MIDHAAAVAAAFERFAAAHEARRLAFLAAGESVALWLDAQTAWGCLLPGEENDRVRAEKVRASEDPEEIRALVTEAPIGDRRHTYEAAAASVHTPLDLLEELYSTTARRFVEENPAWALAILERPDAGEIEREGEAWLAAFFAPKKEES